MTGTKDIKLRSFGLIKSLITEIIVKSRSISTSNFDLLLVNEKIFTPWNRPLTKKIVLKSFEEHGLFDPCAKFHVFCP